MTGGEPAFPCRGELQDRLHIITGEFWELTEKFVRRHASRQVFEDIVDRDAGPANARFSRTPFRINNYVIQEILHGISG